MFECNFTGYILKGFLLWGFLFPTKVRYSLAYKPSEVQEASPGMLVRALLTMISSDSTAESQGCLKLPQNCSPSSPPWGSFLLKYFFITLNFFCFFHFPLPSLAWSGEHPVLGGRDLLGNRFCAWLFHQVGSSFWRQKELPGSWGALGCCLPLAPSCSTFCFVLHCGAGLILPHPQPAQQHHHHPPELPCRKKGDSAVL